MMKLFSTLLFILPLFYACEKKAEFKIPATPDKLVVNALLNKDDVFQVQVLRSYDLLKVPQYLTDQNVIKNAQVIVYKNDLPYDTLIYTPGQVYRSATGKKVAANEQYSLKVSAPGYETVTSSVASLPTQVPIKSLTIIKDPGSSGNPAKSDQIVIEFDDPGTEKNFYWIKITGHYNFTPYIVSLDKDVIIPLDAEITNNNTEIRADKILFKDDNFNGGTKKLVLKAGPNFERDVNGNLEGTLSLRTITEAGFLYMKGVLLSSANNPLSEPVQPVGNIANGFGFFALYTSDTRQLK